MRYFLWILFYLNLCLFVICIIWKNDFLIVVSMAVALMIIAIQRKHQAYVLFNQYSFPKKSFFQYLINLFKKGSEKMIVNGKIFKINNHERFSSNPDLSKGEIVLHALKPVKVEANQIKVKTASDQCIKPFTGALLDLDIPDSNLLSKEMFKGFREASQYGGFAISISDSELDKCKEGNFILKFSVDRNSAFSNRHKLQALFKDVAVNNSVKAIEIVLNKNSNNNSLSEYLDKANNRYFNNSVGLLYLIRYLRYLSNGKPIGIRLSIDDRREFVNFIWTLRDKKIYLDFITILADSQEEISSSESKKENTASKLSLDEAVSFASEALRAYGLEKQIQLWAAGEFNNGFDLLKFVALGASKCINILSPVYLHQNFDNYFFDESESFIKTKTMYIYKKLLNEVAHLMGKAGFASLEQVSSKRFFRRTDPATVKSFNDLYFKSKYSNKWGVFEDFIRLN
ncbi:MAG TPA: hypothetical protein VIK89_03785 [Cytophagaceae bacterium]